MLVSFEDLSCVENRRSRVTRNLPEQRVARRFSELNPQGRALDRNMWSREEMREYEDMRDWLLTCAGINPAVMERLMATLDEVSPPTHGGGGDGQPQS